MSRYEETIPDRPTTRGATVPRVGPRRESQHPDDRKRAEPGATPSSAAILPTSVRSTVYAAHEGEDLFLQFCKAPFEFRCLDRAQLQVQEGRQAGIDLGVNPARVDIRDQPGHGLSHGKRGVQGRQGIDIFVGDMAVPPSPDTAKLGSFVRIWRGSSTGLPRWRRLRRACPFLRELCNENQSSSASSFSSSFWLSCSASRASYVAKS